VRAALPHVPEADRRVVLHALDWASARLLGQPDGAPGRGLVEAYRVLGPRPSIAWTFTATRHALRYGPHSVEEVGPILSLIEILERPLHDDTLVEVRRIAAARSPS